MVQHLAGKHNLDIDISYQPIDNAQQILSAFGKKAPDYVVFDTDTYSYGRILNLANSMSQGHNFKIATLFPEKRMILTNLFKFTP